MTGITSIGLYLPVFRLNRDEIVKVWTGRSTGGTKAVAGYDEDTVTMAVAATLNCLGGGDGAEGLFMATTTAPYREKQSAAIVASVADLPVTTRTGDYTN